MRNGTIAQRLFRHVRTTGKPVFRRHDLARLGGYDQIGRALRRLEADGLVERVGGGLWRLLPREQPRLDVNRTWSKPAGVPDDVLIAATLASPTIADLARLAHAFGLSRLRRLLAEMIGTGEIRPALAEVTTEILTNIEKGGVLAYRRLAG
ncbi:MAG: hypothetical protein HQL41_06685 [Alphaproteobacteria bacterium]|nr:hypothetical protein [Alphaproteobacteria bacterium]